MRIDRPPVDFERSCGLWSLWDMMEKHGFFLAEAVSLLSESKWFWASLAQGGRIGTATESKPITREGMEAATKGTLDHLRRAFILSDLDRLKPDLDRLENLVFRPAVTVPKNPPETIAHAMVHLLARIQDELSSQYYFHLDEQDVQFYGKKAAFGDEVARKLPEAAEDIEAAGNCLALQQPTACVFHLMRAMEVALREMGRKLQVKINPKDTWGAILNNIEPKIKAMPEKTEAQKRKRERWAEARANLFHVKQAWRDNSMHGKQRYDRSHARAIFVAVRTFMGHLASL